MGLLDAEARGEVEEAEEALDFGGDIDGFEGDFAFVAFAVKGDEEVEAHGVDDFAVFEVGVEGGGIGVRLKGLKELGAEVVDVGAEEVAVERDTEGGVFED